MSSIEIRRLMSLLETANVAHMLGSNSKDIRAKLKTSFQTEGKITIDNDGLISIDGNASLRSRTNFHIFPVKFLTVTGDFYCNANQLTSLEGAPTAVGGCFDCRDNKLISLQGAPLTVGTDFQCDYNLIESLQGVPLKVGGEFSCYGNNLTSLTGAPRVINGDFNCSANNLISLEGLPQSVGGRIFIHFSATLPLLRLVGYELFGTDAVAEIINNYVGSRSRSNILACQKELIDASFEGNAAW